MRRSITGVLVSFTVILLLSGLAALACPVGDLDRNCKVDLGDVAVLAGHWLEDGTCTEPNCANIDCAGRVNMGDFALLGQNWREDHSGLIITEFMAVNDSNLPDVNDEYRDWIEIYNPLDTTVDLTDWYLTDNDSNLTKWRFPATVELDSGEFLVVFASQKDRRDPSAQLHTNFKLDDENEDVLLVTPNGRTIAHGYFAYPKQLHDVSYGLSQHSRTLVFTTGAVSYHVPAAIDVDANWTGTDFDDSAWDTGPQPLSFGSGGDPIRCYNDVIYAAGQYKAANVTEYGTGDGFGGASSGPLLDLATGAPTGVTVALTYSGGVDWQSNPTYGGTDCAVGTDAYNTFGGITDMTGVLTYGSTGWWVDVTFTGLDPSTEYTFATSACRRDYTGRLALYQIIGADQYTNASTPGVEIPSPDKAVFDTGGNYSEGYVVRWTGIRAADGTFKVRAQAAPGNPGGDRAYSFDVFMLEGGFGGIDLQQQMQGINASLWTRADFYLEEGERNIYESLMLRMKYEDGFIAYINGVEVARRNFTGVSAWNSHADEDRPIEQSDDFEAISLTSHISALRDGKNVLAIQTLNDDAGDDEFLIQAELVAASGTGVPQYFTTATAGKFNIPGAKGIVSEVWLSHKRGFYNTPFQLILSTADADAQIRYTTDGSRPTITHGNIYSTPLGVNGTSVIRAVAVKPGFLDSKVETHTYIFLGDVITQSPNGQAPGPGWPTSNVNGQIINYGMDPDIVNNVTWGPQLRGALEAIPTISLVTDLANLFDPTIGIYVNAYQDGRDWERPTSVELIYPSNPEGPGFPDLLEVPDAQGGVRWELPAGMRDGFQIDAGVRIRGAFSRSSNNPKHALRLFFRNEYGVGELQYPLFGSEGVDEFDKIDLSTSQNYSWAFEGSSQNTFIRDVFSRDVQREMGQPYTRSRYYHLYINGHYWGLYQTQERADADFAESYLGGDKTQYDVIKNDSSGSRALQATDGTMNSYRRLYDAAVAGFTSNAAYFAVQGLRPDGTPDPSGEELLDPENLMDYMICTYYTGDPDAPVSCWGHFSNNVFAIYNRLWPQGFTWYRHDAEHSLGANGGINEGRLLTDPTDRSIGQNWSHFNPAWLHLRLTANQEYLLQFADRVNKYLRDDGILTAAPNIQRWMTRADQIDQAIIAESARWGDSKTEPPRAKNDWQGQNNYMLNTFFPGRTQIVISQMRSVNMFPVLDAPIFNINGSYQHGGQVSAGDRLTMSNPNGSGNVYYTTDGSDPRQPLTGNAVGIPYSPVTLTKSTLVKARVLYGSTWSALNEAVYAVGPVKENLRITEIMFHPLETGGPEDANEEFIELKNISATTAINLALVRFTNGIDFTFSNLELGAGDYVVVVKKQSAFAAAHPGFTGVIAGEYTGSLDNAGERIELIDAIGQTIHNFRYRDGWFNITDGMGFSLTIKDPNNADPNEWDSKSGWRTSVHVNGSPGWDDSGEIPPAGTVVINEVLAHSHDDASDWIELHNTTNAPVDIGGWFLSDSGVNLTKYEIAEGEYIDPCGYFVLHQDPNFGVLTDPGTHEAFALSENGETVYLHVGRDGELMGFMDEEQFDASETGVSFGRYRKSTGTYNFVPMDHNTPGWENAYPKVGPIVIAEIMYHPTDPCVGDPYTNDSEFEYIELYNVTGSPVTLREWDNVKGIFVPWWIDGVAYTFPASTTISANTRLIVARNPAAFTHRYGALPGGVQLLGPCGKMKNEGETIQLSKPGDEMLAAPDVYYGIRVDRVNYSDGSHDEDFPELPGGDPWPIGPDGWGYSLTKTWPHLYGNDPNNWTAQLPSPGF